MAPAKRPATYADLAALPEHLVGELIDGELVVSPRPRPRHATALGAMFHKVYGGFHAGDGGPGGWWIFSEPEIRLGSHVLVPDIAGWRRERLPVVPDVVGISITPDWVSEVLSPSTARIDRRKKLPIYAAHGVGHVWLVDPVLRTLEVLRRQQQGWLIVATYGDDERICAEPFEAIEIDLARWWLPEPAGDRASEPTAAYQPAR